MWLQMWLQRDAPARRGQWRCGYRCGYRETHPLEEASGDVGAAERAVRDAQVREVHRNLGVVVAQRLLVDSQRAEIDRDRLDVLHLVAEGVAEVDQVGGDLRVLRPQSLLEDGQRQ